MFSTKDRLKPIVSFTSLRFKENGALEKLQSTANVGVLLVRLCHAPVGHHHVQTRLMQHGGNKLLFKIVF